MCSLGAIKPKWCVFRCVLPLCQVALAVYGRGGARPPLPHSPNVTLHAHDMLDIPQLSLQAFQSSLPTPTNFWRWAVVPAQRVCPWSAPWLVLRACLFRLCSLKTHWHKGFARIFLTGGLDISNVGPNSFGSHSVGISIQGDGSSGEELLESGQNFP